MKIKKFRFLLFTPAIILMCFIYSLSGADGEESSSLSLKVTRGIVNCIDKVFSLDENEEQDLVGKLHLPVRKLAHMSEYALLYLLIYLPLLTYKLKGKMLYYIIPLISSFLYACSDEYHQSMIDARCGCFSDVLIDTSGAVLMGLALLGVSWLRGRRKRVRS